MEHAFGVDLGGVRIHRNSNIAPQLAAEAFTTGSDIHFAPGRYQPATSGGQWLLGHELTHVVQQGGARAQRDHESVHTQLRRTLQSPYAASGGIVQRHSSWEHMLIGDLSPKELAYIGASYDIIESADQRVDLGLAQNGVTLRPKREDVLHVIQQEINRLKIFQTKPPQFTTNKGIAGKEAEIVQKDPTWDVKLVGIPNASGKTFLVTYGELNTLADFFGSVEEMTNIDEVRRQAHPRRAPKCDARAGQGLRHGGRVAGRHRRMRVRSRRTRRQRLRSVSTARASRVHRERTTRSLSAAWPQS